MKTINSSQFTHIFEILTDQTAVFIIPSFQRPYSWEARQLNDLFNDMTKAVTIGRGHYFSSFHLSELDSSHISNDEDHFLEFKDNDALNELKSACKEYGQLQDDGFRTIKLYMVVDGQQRLTSLFLLGHAFAACSGSQQVSKLFYVTLRSGVTIPRLIQHPGNDHRFFADLAQQLVSSSPNFSTMSASSQSQYRLLENAKSMAQWSQNNKSALNFLSSKKFEASIILLDCGLELASFMTLNDRGKQLTILEKFKSMLLQYAVDANDRLLRRKLLIEFGKLYRTLDLCIFCGLFGYDGADGDDQLVRLLSCYLRMTEDRNAIWESSQAAYDNFFREKLQDAAAISPANVIGLISDWLKGIQEVAEQLQHLESYLSGRLSASTPSLHYRHCFVEDDYRATLLSLRLQPHFLALLLKFRALYNKEWHERFPIKAHVDPALIQLIQTTLADIRSRSQGHQDILDSLDKLSGYEWAPRNEISMLEIAERIQVLNWNIGANWRAYFVDSCKKTFTVSINEFIQHWGGWCATNAFLENVLFAYNDPNLRYLLKEQERSLGGNLHSSSLVPNISSTNKLELEHVFAKNVDGHPDFIKNGEFPAYGIQNQTDFEQKVLWRSGNVVWLSETANKSLGNDTPDNKAKHYCNCSGHPKGTAQNVCSNIHITRNLGNELSKLPLSAYRLYVEARSVKLAIFGLERFG